VPLVDHDNVTSLLIEGNKQKDVEQEKPIAKHACEKTGNKKAFK